MIKMEKKIKSTPIYDGKIIKVELDEVELPNHQIGYREIVRHNGGVGVLAIIEGKILLVKQYRYAQQAETLEIPAGKIELGEDPYLTGMREIEEETGYHAESLTLFSKALPTPGYCTEVLYLYEANELKKAEHPLSCDEDEFIDVYMMDIQEAYEAVMAMEIIDAKTIIAIMYAYNRYSKKDA